MSSPCDVHSTITRSVYLATGLGMAKGAAAQPWLLSGWKDDMSLPKLHKAAPGRCHPGRRVCLDRYKIFTD